MTGLPDDLLADEGLEIESARPVGGGDICQAFEIRAGNDRLFLKYHVSAPEGLFEAEAAALQALAATDAIRVPAVVGAGSHYLLLEYVPMGGRNAACDHQLGRQLARLHGHRSEQFGWDRDNYIGTTPQSNATEDCWLSFYADQRLRPQVAMLAAVDHTLADRNERLIECLPFFFDDYDPEPALLHGDLWSGNAAATERGEPVIFDPASYFGDPESDLAMTELFGGFAKEFRSGYESVRSVDPGYVHRRPLYQLYHVLNHANLFGGGYVQRAARLMDQLIATAS